jgi:hypothetical protein
MTSIDSRARPKTASAVQSTWSPSRIRPSTWTADLPIRNTLQRMARRPCEDRSDEGRLQGSQRQARLHLRAHRAHQQCRLESTEKRASLRPVLRHVVEDVRIAIDVQRSDELGQQHAKTGRGAVS